MDVAATGGLGGEALERARQRAQHVIVLMLENRSFDQLFGLLDHPERAGNERWFVEVGEHPNPYSVDGAVEEFTVEAAGQRFLERDPPHGHRSALEQVRRNDGRFLMNGFVDEYARKLRGDEPVPTLRQRRIVVAAVVIGVVFGAALTNVLGRTADRTVDGLWPWVLGSALATFGLVVTFGLWNIPTIGRPALWGGAGVVALAIGLAAEYAASRGTRWAILVCCSTLVFLLVSSVVRRLEPKPASRWDEDRVRALAPGVLRCLRPESLPVLAELARTYVTCVRWHSSVPGATWANRNFAHAATSDESVDIEIGLYTDRTIFELLDRERRRYSGDGAKRTPWQRLRERVRHRAGHGPEQWRIYHHDLPQVIAYRRLWRRTGKAHWRPAGQLIDAIRSDDLPTYSFVEPCHTGGSSNSQHPGNNEHGSSDFERGEALIAGIYNALVATPEVFDKTVLVITYDEHGGLFDHVAPEAATPPEHPAARFRARTIGRRFASLFVDYHTDPFDFDIYGVRVPTVVVSPWVGRGSVDTTLYDHASIVATLRRLWAPHEKPLSARDEHANDLAHLLVGSDTPIRGVPFDDRLAHPAVSAGSDATGTTGDLGEQLGRMERVVRRRLPSSWGSEPTIDAFRRKADAVRDGGGA